MRVSPTLSLLLGGGAVFMFAHLAPDWLLHYGFGTIAGSLLVLVGSLYLLARDHVVGIAGFLAIGALYLEHRRRILGRIRAGMYASKAGEPGSAESVGRPAPRVLPDEVHPLHRIPEREEHGYDGDVGPGVTDAESDTFSREEGSLPDGKKPLSSIESTDSASELFQEKGLAQL